VSGAVTASRQNMLPVDSSSRRRTGSGMRRDQYWDAIRTANVKVLRAPLGMARSKENKSRLGYRSKLLIWTVEWLFEDGQRCLVDGLAENSIRHGYDIALRTLERIKKPRTSQKKGPVERRRPLESEAKTLSPQPMAPEDKELEGPLDEPEIALQEDGEGDSDVHNDHLEQVDSTIIESTPPLVTEETTTIDEMRGQTTNHNTRKRKLSTPTLPDNTFIYLLKARTSGSQKVLIPVNPNESLGNVLRNKEIMEFPSFQVLSTPPANISAPYIIEADYLNKAFQEEEEIRKLAYAADDLVAQQDRTTTKPEKVKRLDNDNDIIAILQRDILGV
jgi:hypothetical protein